MSLYFSTWHKRVSLVGSLVSWTSDSPDDERAAICEISLSNTGNQELLVREAHVEPENWGDELVPQIKSPDIPQVIKPGSVVLFKLPIPTLFMEQLANNNRKIILKFEIITPKADTKFATKKLSPFNGGEVSEQDWKPFKLK